MMAQPIQDNLWWVVSGKLAGVRKPNPDELPALRAANIRAIVSVLDDSSNLDVYVRENWPHLWLPVTGGTAPSIEQVRELQAFVDSQDGAVAVHCTNGRRRTGTMLAAYLIASGMSASDALQAIFTANPGLELREAQQVFLQALPKALQR